MPETGTLAQKPAPEIFREMAAGGRSGVLRVANERRVRVVVFEDGRPVYAISNVPDDQLDIILMRQRKITRDQSTAVRREVQKEPDIGPKLVELGFVDAETLEATKLEQVTRIIQNAMLAREGDYTLDLAARVTHDIAIEPDVDQWLLDTARNVTATTARALLGAPDTLYTPVEREGLEMSPLDSFLLGRVTHPMTVDEIRTAGDFSEEEGLPVVYALFASGLLARETAAGRKAAAAAAAAEAAAPEKTVDEFREELELMVASFRQIDYYGVLQIPRGSDGAEVKKAYYALAKLYHPDRSRHVTEPDIRDMLETVFAQITRAYDTLKDDRVRADYDRRLGAGAAKVTPLTSPPPPPASSSRPLSSPPPAPVSQPYRPAASGPLPSSAAAAPPPQPQQHHQQASPSSASEEPTPIDGSTAAEDASLSPQQRAERHFQEGLKHYQNRDVLRAIHLFREAVAAAPEKGAYHLHLGTALTTNPRWYKEAEKHLLEASRTDPMNLQIFLKLGQIYQEGGLKKRAEAQFRQAITLDPGNQIARRGLAEMGLEAPPLPRNRSSGAKDPGNGGGSIFSKLFKKK